MLFRSLLFEIGFIDNSGDNKIFDSKFDDIVNAFVDVIGDNCGLKVKNDKEETEVAEKKDGCFAPIKYPETCEDIADFLHKRGFGAGEHNLALIAAANCKKGKVKDALLELAKKGNLIKPDGLNKKE